jgi:hypothetical protein
MNNAVTVSKSKLKQLIDFAEDQGLDMGKGVIADLKRSIQLEEALQVAEANSYKAPAPAPTNVQEGWVIGTVSTGYVGSRAEFQVCTVKDWSEMSENESQIAVEEALWQIIDVGV